MCFERARASRIAAIVIISFAIAAGLVSLGQQAFAIERELAGLRLWQSYDTIFKKYGVPKGIDIGVAATQITFTDQRTYLDYRTGRPVGGVGAGMGATGPGGAVGPGGGGGGPMMPGGGPYGGPSGGPTPYGGGQETAVYLENEITYYYRVNDVVIIVTVAADHKIAEVGVYAMTSEAQRRGTYKTSRGIGMNNTYVDIINKYGFPNAHQSVDVQTPGGKLGYTVVSYTETNNVSFLLDETYRVTALVIGTNDIFQKSVSQGLGR
jgi:hypothetical protein